VVRAEVEKWSRIAAAPLRSLESGASATGWGSSAAGIAVGSSGVCYGTASVDSRRWLFRGGHPRSLLGRPLRVRRTKQRVSASSTVPDATRKPKGHGRVRSELKRIEVPPAAGVGEHRVPSFLAEPGRTVPNLIGAKTFVEAVDDRDAL